MKTKNKNIRKSTGLFLTVFCLLCFVEKYSMVNAMAEEAEEHFVVEEEASFGGEEVQPANPTHTETSHPEPSPAPPSQVPTSHPEPSPAPSSQVPTSQPEPSQTPSSQTPPSPAVIKNRTSNKSGADVASGYTASDVSDDRNIDMQESISDNNAEFTTPVKRDYLWNVTRQNGNAIGIAEVSQNGLKENPAKEDSDKNTAVTEEIHEGRMPSVIPAILLLIWGILRIIKRLRIVYGKL